MEFRLPRSGFSTRPSLMRDRAAIANDIFGDLQVARTLAHDVSTSRGVKAAADAWAPGLPENSAATLVAVARPCWGRGVSGDSAGLLCGNVFRLSALDAIYTRVWPQLNPRSDAVERRLGFVPAERHSPRDTCGEERMTAILNFELRRQAGRA